jgi:hypothetical protein
MPTAIATKRHGSGSQKVKPFANRAVSKSALQHFSFLVLADR